MSAHLLHSLAIMFSPLLHLVFMYVCMCVCVFVFLGGTNVSRALVIPPEEKRPVVSLDLSEMDQILWVDQENLTAHVQAGIIGQDLERKVRGQWRKVKGQDEGSSDQGEKMTGIWYILKFASAND